MPHKNVHQVPVTVTHGQFKTLMKGGKIRLKKDQLQGGPHVLHINSSVKARKLLSSKAKNKGCEIALAPDEFSATIEGEGFKDFVKWLKGAARTGWKVAKRVGHHLDTIASNAAPGVGQAIGSAAKSAAPVAGKAAAAYLLGGELVKNPGDNVKDMVEGGALFGIHNRTPDHVLMNNNSNFIANTHPAAHPTLIQNDPLAKLHLGKVISQGGEPVSKARSRLAVHPAITPLYNEKANLRNTPAFQRGGSMFAAGYGFKPSGAY